MTQHTDHPASAGRELPDDALRVGLRPGERLIEGEIFYSASWLMDDLDDSHTPLVERIEEYARGGAHHVSRGAA